MRGEKPGEGIAPLDHRFTSEGSELGNDRIGWTEDFIAALKYETNCPLFTGVIKVLPPDSQNDGGAQYVVAAVKRRKTSPRCVTRVERPCDFHD